MLVYCVLKERTVLWVISPKIMRMYTLPIGEQDLQQKVVDVRESMFSYWGTVRGFEPSAKEREILLDL